MPRLFSSTKTEIQELRKIIKQANLDYHTKGKPKLSDKQYDAAKDRLAEISPNDPILTKVGAAPAKRAAKVQLPVFMGSLDKIYIDEVDKLKKWISRYLKSGVTILTHKLDGISALLINEGGKLRLFTRGNGSEGTDISHLIQHLKYIPKLKEGMQVRGEIVISKAAFKKFSKDYENPRNLAAGIANKTKTVHEAAKAGEFIVHEMVKPAAILPRVASQLERMGAKVVDHKVLKVKPTTAAIAKFLETITKTNKYDVDGIVIDNGKGERIAIKQVNEVANVVVKEVKWSVSRHGLLKPVVHIEPVRLAGVTVKQCTGHNAKNIYDNKIGPGALISIVRSGEVIPKIVGVVKGTKAQMPRKGTYEWQGVEIVSLDDSHGDTVKVKQMVHFLTVLGVKNFKDNLIAVLYDAGINDLVKLVKATETRMVAAGLGAVQAKNLRSGLHSALQSTTMPKMMVASGAFGSGFGLTTAKAIWGALGSKALSAPTTRLAALLGEVDGIGKVALTSFVNGRQEFLRFLALTKWEPPKAKSSAKKLSKYTFVFTGFRDAKLQAFLENNGANIAGSISKKVTHVIVREKGFTSEKTKKAIELGSKIITADQARKMVG